MTQPAELLVVLTPRWIAPVEPANTVLTDHAVVIRGDLEMTRGKISVQVSHATIGLHVDLVERDPMAQALWSSLEYPMETYEAKDQASLFKVQMLAKVTGEKGLTGQVQEAHDKAVEVCKRLQKVELEDMKNRVE